MALSILSQEFKDKVSNDLKIEDLGKNTTENIGYQNYYLQLYIEHRSQLLKLARIKDEKYQTLLHHYKFENNYDLRNAELDLYIKADAKFKEIRKLYELKELEVEYLQEIVKMFQNRNFALKNLIELEKLNK